MAKYIISVLAVEVVILLKLFFDIRSPFLLLSLPIMITTWYFGTGSGALSAITALLMALVVYHSDFPIHGNIAMSAGVFVLQSAFFIYVVSQLRHAQLGFAAAVEQEKILRTQAESGNYAKDQFLATLSHELRTPLTSILEWLRLIQTGKLSQAQARHGLEVMERNIKSQCDMVEELLDLSRVLNGKVALKKQAIDINRSVESAIQTVTPTANLKNIRVRSILTRFDNIVEADPRRLQQILWNLLSNAIKFSPNGGLVDVEVLQEVNDVVIRVIDNGTGIAPKFLPSVFDRFTQEEKSNTRVHGGLGIGLAIARHLVQLHGGSISAENRTDIKGAIFTVRLPVNRGNKEPLPVEPAVIPGHFDCKSQLAGLKVLVVEDDPDSLELILTVLQQCGAKPVSANSALQAFDILKHTVPDVILCDLAMPDLTGFEFMEHLRNQGNQTPSAALSALVRDEDKDRALKVGFQTHIAKPVEPLHLAETVANLSGLTPSMV